MDVKTREGVTRLKEELNVVEFCKGKEVGAKVIEMGRKGS